jgi:hypothetical protein
LAFAPHWLTKSALCLLLFAVSLVWADSPNAPPSEQDSGRQLPQIDVHARRMLQRGLDSYIYKVTHGSVAIDDQPIVQWKTPICPLLSGLPHDAGQALFDHFTDVIDSLNRPRGKQGCKPNFIIIVMSQPEARLRDWWQRHPAAFSYDEEGTAKFFGTTDPVRVWYNKQNANLDGIGALDSGVVLDGLFYGVPSFKGHGDGTNPRASYTVVPKLENVIVVVDLEKIVGFAIAPLAEYIAMAGLTKVDLDASFGQTPTILRLFSSPETDRPQGLSSWDRSFLRALYETDQFSRMQRVALVEHMLTDLAP